MLNGQQISLAFVEIEVVFATVETAPAFLNLFKAKKVFKCVSLQLESILSDEATYQTGFLIVKIDSHLFDSVLIDSSYFKKEID